MFFEFIVVEWFVLSFKGVLVYVLGMLVNVGVFGFVYYVFDCGDEVFVVLMFLVEFKLFASGDGLFAESVYGL